MTALPTPAMIEAACASAYDNSPILSINGASWTEYALRFPRVAKLWRAAMQAALTAAMPLWFEDAAKVEGRPIETAPKDETEVLLFGGLYKYASNPSFDVDPCSVVGAFIDSEWCVLGSRYACRATHWRPLPAPPLAPQEKADG